VESVNESTFEGAGTSNHPVDYTGEASDYFSFCSNFYVYTKESTVLGSLTYRMVSDTSIVIGNFGAIVNSVPGTSTITALTANNGLGLTVQIIVIESPFSYTRRRVLEKSHPSPLAGHCLPQTLQVRSLLFWVFENIGLKKDPMARIFITGFADRLGHWAAHMLLQDGHLICFQAFESNYPSVYQLLEWTETVAN
jgi:hypothetical protein